MSNLEAPGTRDFQLSPSRLSRNLFISSSCVSYYPDKVSQQENMATPGPTHRNTGDRERLREGKCFQDVWSDIVGK